MSDITTVEEVQAEDYTVRVAQTADGSAWEAVVLSEDSGGSSGPSVGGMSGMLVMSTGSDDTDDSEDDDAPVGPPVTAPHRWVAIGFAIEAYEWRQVDEDVVDVDDAYKVTEIEDADLSISDGLQSPNTTRQFSSEQGDWSGSLTVDSDNTDGQWFRKLMLAAIEGNGDGDDD